MGFMANVRFGIRLGNLRLVLEAIKQIENWPDYFLDFLSLRRNGLIIYRMKNGLKYAARAGTSDRAVITTVHLADDYGINKISFPPDAVVIDIGSHIGIVSSFIANKVKQVFSYEPVPENYRMLLKNLELNGLSGKVRAFNSAVSGRNGKLRIFLSKDMTCSHSAYGNGKESIEVPAVSLKDVFDSNGIKECELLKIDAEGSEYEMLYGLPQSYFKGIRRISIEYHAIGGEGHDPESLMRFLEILGYRVRRWSIYLFAERV